MKRVDDGLNGFVWAFLDDQRYEPPTLYVTVDALPHRLDMAEAWRTQ